MRRPGRKGTYIRLHIEVGRRTGRFKDPPAFREAQNELLARTGFLEGGMPEALRLDTPLPKERSSVPQPGRSSFPGSGYLTADEAERDVERLGELSFPDDLIEEDGKTLYRCLKKAAKKQAGVAAFYY